MLTVVHDAESSNDNAGASRSLLDEIVRDGARQMLAAALQAEVAAYVEQFVDQVDDNGRRLVVRNGYHRERGADRGRGSERDRAAGQRPPCGPRYRGAAAVFFGDPAGLGTQVAADE